MKVSRSSIVRLVTAAGALLVPLFVLAVVSDGSSPSGQAPTALSAALYAPGPEENDSLQTLEAYGAHRATYPTGNFDREWVQKAVKKDRLIKAGIPAGARPAAQAVATGSASPSSPLALSGTAFTHLGPQPQESHPGTCNGLCFSFGRVAGRVNAIALDPTTTTPGLITAYFASDGGGVWKSTNCCDAATLWTVMTDGANISTTAIDDLFVAPNRWVYAATGDISFGSFAFGSAGILRSKDQGATWEILGAAQLGPAYPVPPPPNNYPQYQAVSKVKVDPNNAQTIIAGTKTGLFFSYDQGVNWKGPCFTNSFSDQRQDITDMVVIDTGTAAVQGQPTTLVAAVGARGFPTTVQPNLGKNGANGVYKLTVPVALPGTPDGCPLVSDWTAQTAGWPSGTASGVPCDPPVGGVTATTPNCPTTTNRLGRIELAVAPSTLEDNNPANDVIYAEVQAVDVHGPEALHGGGYVPPVPASPTPCGVLQRVPAVSSPGRSRGCFLGLFRSANGGNTWVQRADQDELYDLDSAGPCAEDTPQNWYNQGLAVDPTNPDVLFMDTIDIYKSTNGGDTLVDISCGYYTGLITNPVHVDNHVLLYAPPVGGVANTLLAGNDGGIYVSNNASNVPDPAASGLGNPPTFVEINNSVGTIEFYSGDISTGFGAANPTIPPTIVAGAQDNGSSSFQWPNGAAVGCLAACNWQQRIGGDGMYARIEAKQGQRVYMESQNGNIRTSATGHAGLYSGSCGLTTCAPSWPWAGDRKSFVFPYELDKFDCVHNNPSATTCDHIIAGSYRVWESVTTGGVTPAGVQTGWYAASPDLTKGTLADRSFINQLTYAPSDNRVALVGTNDGNVQYGFNLGTNVAYAVPCSGTTCAKWVDVTANNQPHPTLLSAALPNRPIQDVAIDPSNPLVGYAAVGGFDENTPGTPGHVFQVTCTAECATFAWEDKTGNLPNIPVDSIIVNNKFPQQVFAGTDWGLYFTDNVNVPSPVWFKFTNGLPRTMIWDMAIDRDKTALAVFTRGRGAYGLLLPSAAIGGPTSVAIAAFRARAVPRKGVEVTWRTGAENGTLGFHVWRFAGKKGVKVTRSIVFARGGSTGESYRLVDRTARAGVRYTYRLQVVSPDGKRAWRATAALR